MPYFFRAPSEYNKSPRKRSDFLGYFNLSLNGSIARFIKIFFDKLSQCS